MPFANNAFSHLYGRGLHSPESGGTHYDSASIIAPDSNPNFIAASKPAWEGYICVEEIVPDYRASETLDSWRAKARATAFQKLCERCDPNVELSVSCTLREEWRHSSGAHVVTNVVPAIPSAVVLVIICELSYRIVEK